MTSTKLTAAFVGFGEINSPREIIESKCRTALQEVRTLGIDVVTTVPVTDDAAGADVKRALDDLEGKDFDLLIVCLAGWIPSHAVIAVTNAFKYKPMILWGLAGDMEDGRIVTTAAQAGTTALRKIFGDLGYKFRYIYNIIGKPSPLEKLRDFALAAAAARTMERTKIGMMGFRDMGLYNTLYEGISLKSTVGTEVDFFEMFEMVQLSETVDNKDVEALLKKVNGKWTFEKPVDKTFLSRGIAYFLALKKISENNGYDAISLKDVDGMKKLLHFPPAVIFMLLSEELDLCTIPENDVMGAVTQLIIKQVTGQCGAYLEFYEFFDNSVLLGVPDYVPAEVVEGKVKVTPAAFGGISGGLLNVSTMKTGKVTIARLSHTRDGYTMHICTGEGKLKAWEEAGWTQPAPQLPSLEIFLDAPVEDFVQHISGQHYIIAYGDQTRRLLDFCYLKNITTI